MIVAGVMSGTSADGIDVAFARIMGKGRALRLRFLGHEHFAYPAQLRKAILAAMNAKYASVADLARLNVLLGEHYAKAVATAAHSMRLQPQLIGCHGQTIYHQSGPAPFLGTKVACTWQSGEGAVLAARLGVAVVSDFRPADIAAGGTGAPLVPFFDFAYYRHRTRGRILQNIGGIANLTAIPANARLDQLSAFDTGPGNMVIDACMERLYSKSYDASGRVAAKGQPLNHVLRALLRHRYFAQKPPKTTGREQFGREFTARFIQMCRGAKKEDVIATATALTARTISAAIRDFVHTKKTDYSELIVSGGGAKNLTLMRLLRESLAEQKVKVRTADELGVPNQAKEALAFALLAYETWHRRPANVPSATGARRPAVLGKLSLP